MKSDPDIVNRHSIRLKKYDYSQSGAYFITLCAKDKRCSFGEVIDGKVNLNSFGVIARTAWEEIPVHFPNVVLNVFCVMPNHIHGILIIDNLKVNQDRKRGFKNNRQGAACCSPTSANNFTVVAAGSLPAIVRSYKSAVTKQINMMMGYSDVSVWQRNYFERVIRSEKELSGIGAYIINNPASWKTDNVEDDIHSIIESV